MMEKKRQIEAMLQQIRNRGSCISPTTLPTSSGDLKTTDGFCLMHRFLAWAQLGQTKLWSRDRQLAAEARRLLQ